MFKRFGRPSARNLLHMQSELAELDAQQEAYDREDFGATLSEKESMYNWRMFKQRSLEGTERDRKRMEPAERTSHVLTSYSRYYEVNTNEYIPPR